MAGNAGLPLYLNWLEFIEKEDGESLTSEFLSNLKNLQLNGTSPSSTNGDLQFLYDLFIPAFITGLDKWKKTSTDLDISEKKDVLVFPNWVQALAEIDPLSTANYILISIYNIFNGHNFQPLGNFRVDTFLTHILNTQTKRIENRTKKTDQPYINYPTNNQMRTNKEPTNILEKTNSDPNPNQTLSKLPIGNKLYEIGNMLKIISNRLNVIENREYDSSDIEEEIEDIQDMIGGLDGIKDSIDIVLEELTIKEQELEEFEYTVTKVLPTVSEDGTKWRNTGKYLSQEESEYLDKIKQQILNQ